MSDEQEILLRELKGELPRIVALARRAVLDLRTDSVTTDRIWSALVETREAAKRALQAVRQELGDD